MRPAIIGTTEMDHVGVGFSFFARFSQKLFIVAASGKFYTAQSAQSEEHHNSKYNYI